MTLPFDLGALAPLLGNFQENVKAMQEQAASTRVEGTAGGGLVRVVANGAQEVLEVHIGEAAMDDRELLEDLVRAAANDAIRRSKEVLTDKLGALTGGLLPPGLLG